MTTALSKRHQARNEKALQELIKTVPGNDRCADCGAKNPGLGGGGPGGGGGGGGGRGGGGGLRWGGGAAERSLLSYSDFYLNRMG